MKILNLEARYRGEIKLPEEVIKALPSSLALVATVQYLSFIDPFASKLRKKGKKVVIPYFKGTFYKGQILGCSLNRFKGDFDAFFYIGDGRFHPLTLLYQNDKEVFCFNPLSLKLSVMGKEEKAKLLKRRKVHKLKFLNSKHVGIIISIKPGQYNPFGFQDIKKGFPDKKFYHFIGDTINIPSLNDFSFIDCFINTACPRLAYDSIDEDVCILDISEVRELMASF